MSDSILRSYAEEQALLETGKYERADDGGVKIKDGYFASDTAMDGYGEAKIARSNVKRFKGAGGGRVLTDNPSTKFIYKKDEMPKMPKAVAPAAPEVSEPKELEDDSPTELSPQVQKAQSLVDKYVSNITGGNNIYSTQVDPTTTNLNTESDFATNSADTNSLGDGKLNNDDTASSAADSFLEKKMLKLNSGLNLK